jgi:hypothetical protein
MSRRFLLLFHARSGSNLITMALAAHPAIVMYGELFHHMEAVRKDVRLPGAAAASCGQTDYYRDGSDPVAFLQAQLYDRTFPPEKTAVGFKMAHFHMRSEANTRLCALAGVDAGPRHLSQDEEDRFWNWLGADREIRIISLYRRSLLQAMVSGLRATKSNQWWLSAGARPEPSAQERLRVPIEQFREFVDLMTANRERAGALLADHPMLTLEYQDVVGRFDVTMQRIEEFLGVAPLAVRQPLQKQAQMPVSEAIVNYAELREAVAGTQYEAYL